MAPITAVALVKRHGFVVLLAWPDTQLPKLCVTRFLQHGLLERSGVLRRVLRRGPMTVEEVLCKANETVASHQGCSKDQNEAWPVTYTIRKRWTPCLG